MIRYTRRVHAANWEVHNGDVSTAVRMILSERHLEDLVSVAQSAQSVAVYALLDNPILDAAVNLLAVNLIRDTFQYADWDSDTGIGHVVLQRRSLQIVVFLLEDHDGVVNYHWFGETYSGPYARQRAIANMIRLLYIGESRDRYLPGYVWEDDADRAAAEYAAAEARYRAADSESEEEGY